MYDGLTYDREPPPNRRGKCAGGRERHLPEAAVMLAVAMHLLRTRRDVREVKLYPDGEHGKRFDVRGWLQSQGFVHEPGTGRTNYSGVYRRGEQSVTVKLTPGVGDVVAEAHQGMILAEC